jgi:hypothetical protein
MERRAKIFKPLTSSYEDRYQQATAMLAQQWETKRKHNEGRRNDPKANRTRYTKRGRRKRKEARVPVFYSYGEWLKVIKDFPKFLNSIVDDYFPMDDDSLHWDVGQIAFNSGGGLENKSLVRDILMRVDKIGKALFPEPPAQEVVQAPSPTDNAKSETFTSCFDNPDFDTPF